MKRSGRATTAIAAAALLLIAGATIGGTVGTALWALAVPLVPAELAVLAAPRRSRAGRAVVALALAAQLSLLALALLPAAEGSRPGGLPLGTWWMLLGLGAVPLIAVPFVYAWRFAAADRGEDAGS